MHVVRRPPVHRRAVVSLCRGCAGSGVDISASPRAVQVAAHGLMIRFPEGAKRKRDVLVTLDLYPLAALLTRIEGYVALGGVPDHPFPLSARDFCSWCNGHGDSDGQLSTHALELATQGGRL